MKCYSNNLSVFERKYAYFLSSLKEKSPKANHFKFKETQYKQPIVAAIIPFQSKSWQGKYNSGFLKGSTDVNIQNMCTNASNSSYVTCGAMCSMIRLKKF